jgi:hypothetical protein
VEISPLLPYTSIKERKNENRRIEYAKVKDGIKENGVK